MPFKYFLNEPYLEGNEKKYLSEVIDNRWLSAGGNLTKQFEEKFADHIGLKYCLAVQSGTAALHTALLALGIKQKDKVIIPNYTCSACATSVIQAGADPVIIDVEKETFGLNFDDVKVAIEELDDIKAIMPVHVYGFPLKDFSKIISLAKEKGIFILEDTSEAHGATLKGKKLGSFGDLSAFYIRSEKMLGVGEGGVVLTDNKNLHDKALFYASRGCDFNPKENQWWERYYYKAVGMNYKLPHALGAIALAQMENFPRILQIKRSIGEKYAELLRNEPEIILQRRIDNSEPVYWLNAIVLKNKTKEEVREIGKKLIEKQIEIRPGFWPLGDLEYLKKYSFGTQEKGNYLFDHMIILPSSVNLAKNDFDGVIEITSALKELL